MTIERILIPTRPQPDTIVAILLLQEYGSVMFPGVTTARVEIKNAVAPEDTFESLLEKGTLALDVGGGPFDHHDTGKTASELVAKALGIGSNPELKQLIAYAVRDDTQGKGTLSRDPLDRAFGLSGLIAALNKLYVEEPDRIVSLVVPLLSAHLHMTRQHTVELPKDILRKKEIGEYVEVAEEQGGTRLKIAFVTSEKPAMPGYLRAQSGRNADVVVQKTENGNHYAILSKQQKKVNLSKVMALIRLREAELQGIDLPVSEQELEQIRTIEHIPNWYYDPATNSLLNGGPHNRTIAESKIPWEEMLKIVPLGIRLGTPYSESPNFICDGKTYEYGRAYLMLPLAVSGLPSTISVEGLDLHLKSDFHVTLLCVKNLIRKYGPKIEDKILRLFCSFIRQHPITFVRFTGEYRFAETNNRKSVVALCEVANLDAFFTLAKKELHISLPFQPTHVTLYTLQPGAGIGLNSETEMEQMSHPVNLPNEIGYTLAKGGKA